MQKRDRRAASSARSERRPSPEVGSARWPEVTLPLRLTLMERPTPGRRFPRTGKRGRACR
ncbi:MAG: hypothetical protein ACLR8Y_00375 [Alistipes indistinctus]